MTRRLTGICSMATRRLMLDMAGAFERQTSVEVSLKALPAVEAAQAVRAGESFDIIVLASNVMLQLLAEGRIADASWVNFARSGISIAVASGARLPEIGTEEAVRNSIVEAKGICFSTGSTGEHLKALFERWGITEFMRGRLLEVKAGAPVGQFVACGDAEMGFQQFSELINYPGINVVGPLPPPIQLVMAFAAGTSPISSNARSARAFVAYLGSQAAAAAKRMNGMEPA